MKNACLLVIALALLTGSAFSQDDFQKFKFGFELDPNISWFKPKNNNLISDGAVARIGGGLNADIFFAKNYAFGTGFYVRTRGGKLNYLSEYQETDGARYIVNTDRIINTKFIEVPLTFKLKTSEIGYMTYYGQFGLGLGFNIGATGDETLRFENVYNSTTNTWDRVSDVPAIEEENINFTSEVASLRTSMIIAFGVEYSLSGTTALKAGLTFNNGFSNGLANKTDGIQTAKGSDDILLEQDPDENNQPKTYELNAVSNSISLNIGIMF